MVESTKDIIFDDHDQPEGGVWAGISRDLHVLGAGLAQGLGGGLDDARKHPIAFLGEQLAPMGLMLAARGPASIRTAATVAGAVGTVVFAAKAVGGISRTLPALDNAYRSNSHLEEDKASVAQNLGPVAFDALAMAATGLAAAKLGTALYGLQKFKVTGLEEPQQLSGAFARSIDRAAPSLIRITGEIPSTTGINAYHGSGVIFDKDGYALTSLHNVDPLHTRAFDVILSNGEHRSWQLIGEDRVNDLALLKIAKKTATEEFPATKLDLRDVKQNTPTIGLGFAKDINTLEAVPSTYRGVRALDADQVVDPLDKTTVVTGSTRNFFQGNFEHGQSGSPILNAKGKIIGIVTNVQHMPDGTTNFGTAARPRYISALLKDTLG